MNSSDDWLGKIPVQNEDLAWRMIDDEAIIIAPSTSHATVLNSVAARIWELSDGSRSLAQIVDTIVAEYDVDPMTAQQDARELMDELTKRGLIGLSGDS